MGDDRGLFDLLTINAKTFLAENPEMAFEIENKVREKFGLPVQDSAVLESAEPG